MPRVTATLRPQVRLGSAQPLDVSFGKMPSIRTGQRRQHPHRHAAERIARQVLRLLPLVKMPHVDFAVLRLRPRIRSLARHDGRQVAVRFLVAVGEADQVCAVVDVLTRPAVLVIERYVLRVAEPRRHVLHMNQLVSGS